ncbi:hypothetical protein SS50377_28115 [Spironucleus salmonicida]|uniref:Clathrin/coatomer adaptor adaptin-like N-terminal domain-containing protein n=1 Tax=Spironucleus salmonicida TaxID=348837 RepID=V6LE70_9EUKA|nr:hypothetical protein SS50377_28115 [Spironucleus salmonicida]|eukprot:EST42800.1 hypothetical protein SS50377_17569 [Spironucleus salmonicida]
MKSLQHFIGQLFASTKQDELITIQLKDIILELSSTDVKVAQIAVQKLIFIYQLFNDLKPFAFSSIQLIGRSNFSLKKLGYLTANFTFGLESAALLASNTIKNDLSSTEPKIQRLAATILSNSISEGILSQLFNLKPTKFLLPGLLKQSIFHQKQVQFIQYLGKNISFISVQGLIFTKVAAEVSKYDATAISLLPAIYNFFKQSQNPWDLVECIKFMKIINRWDKRIEVKIRQDIVDILQKSQSFTLIVEVVKFIADSNYDQDMFKLGLRKMSQYILHQSGYTDENIKILSIRNIALLQKQQNGIGFQVSQLVENVVLQLENNDFNMKMSVLEVIGSLASRENVVNIVNKILYSISQSTSGSLQEIFCFKNQAIKTCLHVCSVNNYQNITDFTWLLETYIKLQLEFSSYKPNLVIQELYQLVKQSKQVQENVCGIIIQIIQFQPYIELCAVNRTGPSNFQGQSTQVVCQANFTQFFDSFETEVIQNASFVMLTASRMICQYFCNRGIKNTEYSLSEVVKCILNDRFKYYACDIIISIQKEILHLIITFNQEIQQNDFQDKFKDTLQKSIQLLKNCIEDTQFDQDMLIQQENILYKLQQLGPEEIVCLESLQDTVQAQPKLLSLYQIQQYQSDAMSLFLSKPSQYIESSDEIFVVATKFPVSQNELIIDDKLSPMMDNCLTTQSQQKVQQSPLSNPFLISPSSSNLQSPSSDRKYLKNIKIEIKQEDLIVQTDQNSKDINVKKRKKRVKTYEQDQIVKMITK